MTFFNPNANILEEYNQFKEVHKGIWKMENFLTEDIVSHYLSIVQSMSEDEWAKIHWTYEEGDTMGSFWHKRMSKWIHPHERIHSEFYRFFAPEQVPLGMLRTFNRMLPGEITTPELCTMSNAWENNNNFNAKYRIGLYIGEFTGGDLVFPEIDFKLNVKQNDIVVWEYPLKHYVAPVTSGIRYSYSDYLVPPADVWFS